MKRYLKYPLIGLGILLGIVIIFLVLAFCGVFRHEHQYQCGTPFHNHQSKENDISSSGNVNPDTGKWIEEP